MRHLVNFVVLLEEWPFSYLLLSSSNFWYILKPILYPTPSNPVKAAVHAVLDFKMLLLEEQEASLSCPEAFWGAQKTAILWYFISPNKKVFYGSHPELDG